MVALALTKVKRKKESLEWKYIYISISAEEMKDFTISYHVFHNFDSEV